MTDQPDFELYGFWRTSATYRVRVALNLKGLTAHERVIDLDAGEQLNEDFLKINPLGAIPALIVKGQLPLTQSLAILEFLDETHPLPPLLPGDPHGRARVRSIAAMLAADTHPLITPRVRKYLSTVAGFDDAAVRAWLVHWFDTGLAAVERRLASEAATGTFCHGDHDHHRRYLPRQHHGDDARAEDSREECADHRPDRRALRGAGGVCQGRSAEATRRAKGVATTLVIPGRGASPTATMREPGISR
ncbi:maleylacetoacetate isomerase [Nitrobacteraceae bacterium AZCC 2146]